MDSVTGCQGDTYSRVNDSADRQWHLERARIIQSIESETALHHTNKYWTMVRGKPHIQVTEVQADPIEHGALDAAEITERLEAMAREREVEKAQEADNDSAATLITGPPLGSRIMRASYSSLASRSEGSRTSYRGSHSTLEDLLDTVAVVRDRWRKAHQYAANDALRALRERRGRRRSLHGEEGEELGDRDQDEESGSDGEDSADEDSMEEAPVSGQRRRQGSKKAAAPRTPSPPVTRSARRLTRSAARAARPGSDSPA